MWTRWAARRRGFILLETLMGLTILGLALGVLLPRVGLSSRLALQAADTEAAVGVAERLLAGLGVDTPLTPDQVPQIVMEGEEADGRPWRITTCCARQAAPGVGLALVDVTVEVGLAKSGAGQADRSLALTTRRLLRTRRAP